MGGKSCSVLSHRHKSAALTKRSSLLSGMGSATRWAETGTGQKENKTTVTQWGSSLISGELKPNLILVVTSRSTTPTWSRATATTSKTERKGRKRKWRTFVKCDFNARTSTGRREREKEGTSFNIIILRQA